MKRLSVFLLSSFLTMLFFCFSAQAEDRRLPTIEVLKTWPRIHNRTIVRQALNPKIESQFGKTIKIDSFIYTPPKDQVKDQAFAAIDIGFIKAIDGSIHAIVLSCMCNNEPRFPKCGFETPIVLWDSNAVAVK